MTHLTLMCLTMLAQLLCSIFQRLTSALCCIMLSKSSCQLLLELLDKTRSRALLKHKLRVSVQILHHHRVLPLLVLKCCSHLSSTIQLDNWKHTFRLSRSCASFDVLLRRSCTSLSCCLRRLFACRSSPCSSVSTAAWSRRRS
jgi:hypothetical protein